MIGLVAASVSEWINLHSLTLAAAGRAGPTNPSDFERFRGEAVTQIVERILESAETTGFCDGDQRHERGGKNIGAGRGEARNFLSLLERCAADLGEELPQFRDRDGRVGFF